jgi:hypothetical protein
VSIQVAILKVLSGHPQGRATVDAMNADLRILGGCSDWNARMKRLAARAPDLDIFGQRLVVRDSSGWQLTGAGRAALASLETIGPYQVTVANAPEPQVTPVAALVPAETTQPVNVVDLNGVRRQRRAWVALVRSA